MTDPDDMGTGILCRGCGGECERGDRDAICHGCRGAYDLGRASILGRKFKRLTKNVLDGIIAATEQVLAGPSDGEMEGSWDDICRANTWARDVRDARSKREVHHEGS